MSRQGSTSAKFINYYELLRVRPYDSQAAIQDAFYLEIKKWHPDKNTGETPEDKHIALHRTKLLIEARSILTDLQKKSQYDADFERLYPRRFQKLNTPRDETINLQAIQEKQQQNRLQSLNSNKVCWYDFSSKINRQNNRVTYNLQRFIDRNPIFEARMRFNVNCEWTEFSRRKHYRVSYPNLNVALAEMQIRYKDKKGKYHYYKPIMKVIILSKDPFIAIQDKYTLLKRLETQRRRMAYKVIVALISSGFLAVQAFLHHSWV